MAFRRLVYYPCDRLSINFKLSGVIVGCHRWFQVPNVRFWTSKMTRPFISPSVRTVWPSPSLSLVINDVCSSPSRRRGIKGDVVIQISGWKNPRRRRITEAWSLLPPWLGRGYNNRLWVSIFPETNQSRFGRYCNTEISIWWPKNCWSLPPPSSVWKCSSIWPTS